MNHVGASQAGSICTPASLRARSARCGDVLSDGGQRASWRHERFVRSPAGGRPRAVCRQAAAQSGAVRAGVSRCSLAVRRARCSTSARSRSASRTPRDRGSSTSTDSSTSTSSATTRRVCSGTIPVRVAAAVHAALDRGWSFGATHVDEIRFAELVCQRFPSIEQVRFTNSGTEANLMALQLARHCTGRDRIAVFDAAYHGGLLYFGHGGEALQAPFDYVRLPYNDIDGVRAAVDETRRGAARRTDDGGGRLHPRRARIPRRAPRRLRSHGRAVDLRRGDDVADERRWRAAAIGRATRT